MHKPPDVSLPSAQHRNTERLRYIDALRAIAALLVSWLHAVYAFKRIADEGGAGGAWLAAGDANGRVWLWDQEGKALRTQRQDHRSAVLAIGFGPS